MNADEAGANLRAWRKDRDTPAKPAASLRKLVDSPWPLRYTRPMEIGAALYVLLAIAVAILATREFGRSGPGWFFLSLFLTPLAGLLLFLLPPRRRPCPFCAESIQAAATVCRYCGRDVAPLTLSTALPMKTRIVLAILVTAVLVVALSQCHTRFQWWRGGGGIQVESRHWSLVNGHWFGKRLLHQ